jgi:hypothetical protein
MLRSHLPKEVPAGDVTLSLVLHAPQPVVVPSATGEPGKVLLHLEIRNNTLQAWEGSTEAGPLLEMVLLDSEGHERSRQTRQCRMLAYPTRLEPGRGFNLPLFFTLPGLSISGEDFRIEIRLVPGREVLTGHLRVEPR